ncbi:hypothetical protein BRC77_01085 [Halobacteriales archaeon QH_8_64_26]|nr:MAG: hypothetical protein BRC77_01085 [Halobacteriales archaeon QH_8_64_26]
MIVSGSAFRRVSIVPEYASTVREVSVEKGPTISSTSSDGEGTIGKRTRRGNHQPIAWISRRGLIQIVLPLEARRLDRPVSRGPPRSTRTTRAVKRTDEANSKLRACNRIRDSTM